MRSSGLVTRNLQPVIGRRLAEEPVVVLTGARTVGKSTLLRACAQAHEVSYLDLDDDATRKAVAADPALFAAGTRDPVCIDEFQHVPRLLDAIKAELNADLRPGRYLLTGSTRYGSLPRASQSLTGRAHVMTMWPLSQGELHGRRETFLDVLMDEPAALVAPHPSSTLRSEYERLILTGGFPLAVGRPEPAHRDQWFRSFIRMVIERDVLEIRKVRQRRILPLLLEQLAARTGSLLNVSDIARDLQLETRLVNDLVALLESVFLAHRLDAFGRTLSSRVGRVPKIHLVDSGLAAYLHGVTEAKLAARKPATLTEFGHIVETFAVNELLKQAGWATTAVRFSHFRTRDNQEVDLVAETDDGRIAAVEVKASTTVAEGDFRGLRHLRDLLGADFVGGVLLNLGQRSYTADRKIYVMPLDRLWT